MYDFRIPDHRLEIYNVVTNGKGGIYRWQHDELPEGEGWAWVQKKPIDPKFWSLARWQLSEPRRKDQLFHQVLDSWHKPSED